MLEIFVAIAIYGTFFVDYVGTYQVTPYTGGILRTDTRTGRVEVCKVSGTPPAPPVMTCEAIKVESK
jgi:hypothetical protein